MPGHSHAQMGRAGRRIGEGSYQDAGLSWTDARAAVSALATKARDELTAMQSVYGAATPADISQATTETFAQAQANVAATAQAALQKLEDEAKSAATKTVVYTLGACALTVLAVLWLAPRKGRR